MPGESEKFLRKKTEWEKMLNGDWYNANFDPELLAKRRRARELCFSFNHTNPANEEEAAELLKQILALEELPSGLEILAPVYFDYGTNTRFGAHTFINHNCYFMDGGEITIGDHCFIGPSCGFYTACHPMEFQERNKGLELAKPITVGDNCWFGGNVTVLPGVRIGNGCVIAAGSVVLHDIPDSAMAAGNPARVKKIVDQ